MGVEFLLSNPYTSGSHSWKGLLASNTSDNAMTKLTYCGKREDWDSDKEIASAFWKLWHSKGEYISDLPEGYTDSASEQKRFSMICAAMQNGFNPYEYDEEGVEDEPDEEDYDDDDYEREQKRISRAISEAKDGFQCYRCNLWYPTKYEMNDCIQSCKEYGDKNEAESFDAQDCGWCGDKIVGGGTREGEKVCSACVVAYDKENNRGSPCVVCDEKTEMGAYSYGKGEWVSICSKDCELDYDDYEAESFEADAESFSAPSHCASCGWNLVQVPIGTETKWGVAIEGNQYYYNHNACKGIGKLPIKAESFDAQTKITGYTRGKDWEGKPYTGQIFPDHSDLDPELADRNQDGKMASWERAIGNQVARGKSRFKAPRKMLNPRLPQMKSSTTHSSILPYALAVGALATIMGLRNMGGSNE